jgi:hypothetical protein
MEGWGDDDLDFDVDLDIEGNINESTSIEGRTFDSALKSKLCLNDAHSTIHNSQIDMSDPDSMMDINRNLSSVEKNIAHSLEDYMRGLPSTITSLKSVFEVQNNENENAHQLVKYYESRPKLRDYTIKTELPRMEYIVITKEKKVLESKQEVESYMLTLPDNVLIRSANQSLLADVISNLTGPDLFIRPQYLASAIASMCKFTIEESIVHCDCHLCLSLPGCDGCAVKVAELDIIIEFVPEISYIKYMLSDVMFCIDSYKRLDQSAQFLATVLTQEVNEEYQTHVSNPDAYRDSLLIQLSKTRQVIEYGQVGLSSAWEQIDRAASVTQKLKFVKSVGDALLPTFPTINFEEPAYNSEYNHVSKINLANNRDESTNISQMNHDSQKRVPIIGGLLMSGLSRLTNSMLPRGSEDMTVLDSFTAHVPLNIPTASHAYAAQTENWDNMYHEEAMVETNVNAKDDLNVDSYGWSDDEISIEEQISFQENCPANSIMRLPTFDNTNGVDLQECKSDIRKIENSSNVSTEYWRTESDYNPQLDILPTRKRWINTRASTGRF